MAAATVLTLLLLLAESVHGKSQSGKKIKQQYTRPLWPAHGPLSLSSAALKSWHLFALARVFCFAISGESQADKKGHISSYSCAHVACYFLSGARDLNFNCLISMQRRKALVFFVVGNAFSSLLLTNLSPARQGSRRTQ